MSTHGPLLRNGDYMLLWSGQVVSTLGSAATRVVYPLLILSLTGSPAAAGIAAALGSIPYLIFSLPAGALIDRWDRKRIMIVCDLGRALTVLTVPIALWLDVLSVWQLYAAAFSAAHIVPVAFRGPPFMADRPRRSGLEAAALRLPGLRFSSAGSSILPKPR